VDQVDDALIIGNLAGFVGSNAIESSNSSDLTIRDNIVGFALNDGINVSNTDRLLIDNNQVGFVLNDGIDVSDGTDVTITDNDVNYALLGNGIEASGVTNLEIRGNDVGLAGWIGGNGIDVRGSDIVLIHDNEVGTFVNGDGIYVNPSSNVTISSNKITGVGQSGIHLNGNPNVNVINNTVTGSGTNGLYVSGGSNGAVVIAGNTFNNNPVGLNIESGTIDLTGSTNFINGGNTGILFNRFGGTAPLSLVAGPGDTPGTNGTFGTTTFTGQTGPYIALANNAFSLGPDAPIFLDATYATFDGFSPNSMPRNLAGIPMLTQAQFDFLESKFLHFNDLNTLGLLLFGFGPEVAQEDILRFFDPTNLQISGLNVTVLGLPQIPGAPAQFNTITPFAGGGATTAAALNNIATAAGGEGGGVTASALNAIDPAAGGQSASCWGDAMGMAASGGAVNMNYTSSAEDTLAGAASCGSGI